MWRKLDVWIAFVAVLIYVCNTHLWSLDAILPYWFSHYYLNDLCGGVLFPAYVNLIVHLVTGEEIVTTYARALLMGASCSLAWEVVAPALLTNSTADPLDAIAYVVGMLAYTACYRSAKRK